MDVGLNLLLYLHEQNIFIAIVKIVTLILYSLQSTVEKKAAQ